MGEPDVPGPDTDITPSDEQQLLRVALETFPGGMLLLDDRARILRANPGVERMFGYSNGELRGQPVEVLIPESTRDEFIRDSTQYLADPKPRRLGTDRPYNGRRKDGSLVSIEVRISPVHLNGRLWVLVSLVDTTERERLRSDLHDELEDRLTFETLIADLAARFINLPPGDVAGAIQDAQREIVLALGLDRSVLFQFDETTDDLVNTHTWARPGVPEVPPRLVASSILPWAMPRIRGGETLWISSPDEVPSPVDRRTLEELGVKSTVGIPLSIGGRVIGAISFGSTTAVIDWAPELLNRLRVVAHVFANALARQRNDEAAGRALDEATRVRDSLEVENTFLRREISGAHASSLIGRSDSVTRAMEQIQQVAPTDATVLLLGETGTGKELFATYLHDLSSRAGRMMVRVSCAAIPVALVEAELFGREKGAYTGASTRQAGRFELAHQSTIFLDEIGDLPMEVQVKLLRVLQEKQIERLGSATPVKVDVRIIAATHRNLEALVAEGAFRADLFYRLNVFPIHVPPLRERSGDVPLLVWQFVEEFSRTFGKRIDSISQDSLAALQAYSWPGNVRELRNVVERAMILATGPRLEIALPRRQPHLRSHVGSANAAEVQAQHMRAVLDSTGWRVRGAGGAAERLGLKPSTLESRMAKHGLRRPGKATN